MLSVIKTQMRHIAKLYVPVEKPVSGFSSFLEAWSDEPDEFPVYFYEDTRLTEDAIGNGVKVSGRLGNLLTDRDIPFGSRVEIYRDGDLLKSGFTTVPYNQQNINRPEYHRVAVADWVYPGFKPVFVSFLEPSSVASRDGFGQVSDVLVPIEGFSGVVAHRQMFSLELDNNVGTEMVGYLLPDVPPLKLGVVISEEIDGSEDPWLYQVVSGQEYNGFYYLSGRKMDGGIYCKR